MMPKGRAAWVAMQIEGCDMIKLNLAFFHQVGAQLGRLTNLTAGNTRGDIAIAASWAESYVRTLLTNDIVPLKICQTQGQQLLDAISSMQNKIRTYAPPPAGTPGEWALPPTYQDAEFYSVLNTAKSFETVLQAEIDSLPAYYVGSKGIYDTDKLIGIAEQALPEGMLQYLDPKAGEDMRSSGRCLGLDMPTASGFHILRATECVLYRYYLAVCNPDDKKPLGGWSDYLAELYKVSGGKDKVTDSEVREAYHILMRIKEHRNNIMHPEWVLTPDQAFTLFENAKSAIMVMLPRLSTREDQAVIDYHDRQEEAKRREA